MIVGSGTLIVRPLTAKLTRDTESGGKMDPYCCIVFDKETKKTKVHNDAGKNPSWNDSFTFRRNNEQLIQIQVWDQDTVSSDDLVGETSISLNDILLKKNVTEWYSLTYKGKSSGQIMVGFEFAADNKNNAISQQNFQAPQQQFQQFQPQQQFQNMQQQQFIPQQQQFVQPNQQQGFNTVQQQFVPQQQQFQQQQQAYNNFPQQQQFVQPIQQIPVYIYLYLQHNSA